tara:strand:+ start:1843 stop:1980 length:138 start_codon:yes stop_codon:yes gene_type:complete
VSCFESDELAGFERIKSKNGTEWYIPSKYMLWKKFYMLLKKKYGI